MSKWSEVIEREAAERNLPEWVVWIEKKNDQARAEEEAEFWRSVEDGSYWKEGDHAAE